MYLEVRDVKKSYGKDTSYIQVLKGVSTSVEKGQMCVIQGTSGSGKSTLLNCIGGLDTMDSGSVIVDGKEIFGLKPAELSDYRRDYLGFIFQFYNLLPGLTAFENIALSAELSKNSLDPEKLLEEVGLKDRRDHFPNRLSGGEQQRIAIARARCKNPDLLLCDEPTGALDSATGIQVLRLLEGFCRSYEKTVILITHNQDIARIADRVFYFKDGRLERIEENPHPLKPDEISW